MKKIILVLGAVTLMAAGCNKAANKDVESFGSNTPSNSQNQAQVPENVTADMLITEIEANAQAEQAAVQSDDSDLFKSSSNVSNFAEVSDAN